MNTTQQSEVNPMRDAKQGGNRAVIGTKTEPRRGKVEPKRPFFNIGSELRYI